MTISSSYPAPSAYQTNPPGGMRQDFRSLSAALQSGDISSAQSAFATLQNDLKSAPANSKASALLDPNTPAGKDFKALQDALKSGDVKAAQTAFVTLRKDLQAGKAHGHHHHHKADNDGDADDKGGGSSGVISSPSAMGNNPPAVGSFLNVSA